jgi:hypothetical protein
MGPPSYWAGIAESPTRVTLHFRAGGEEFKDLYSTSGQYGTISRRAPEWNNARTVPSIDAVPEQLLGVLEEKDWKELVAEVKESVDTFPPPCRFCIFSFLYSTVAQYSYINKAKKNLQAFCEKHSVALKQKGVEILFFDKTGMYSCTQGTSAGGKIRYSKHFVFGLFIDVK